MRGRRASADASDAGGGLHNATPGPNLRSALYAAPAPFQDRSLEGAPSRGRPKELARSLDADIPVEDLHPVEPRSDEPGMRSIADTDPLVDVSDDDDSLAERRAAYVKNIRLESIRERDSVHGGAGDRTEAQGRNTGNDSWAALLSSNRASPVAFSDEPRRALSLIEHEIAPRPDQGGRPAEPDHGDDLPDLLDRTHSAHYAPEPWNRMSDCEAGFGRVPTRWNEFPFSSRERILNALSKGESLSHAPIDALETATADYCTAYDRFPSSQYRSIAVMASGPGSEYRRGRWLMRASRRSRLLQLIEMLDHAVEVV